MLVASFHKSRRWLRSVLLVFNLWAQCLTGLSLTGDLTEDPTNTEKMTSTLGSIKSGDGFLTWTTLLLACGGSFVLGIAATACVQIGCKCLCREKQQPQHHSVPRFPTTSQSEMETTAPITVETPMISEAPTPITAETETLDVVLGIEQRTVHLPLFAERSDAHSKFEAANDDDDFKSDEEYEDNFLEDDFEEDFEEDWESSSEPSPNELKVDAALRAFTVQLEDEQLRAAVLKMGTNEAHHRYLKTIVRVDSWSVDKKADKMRDFVARHT